MSRPVVDRRDIMFPDCPPIRPSRLDVYSAYLTEPVQLDLDNGTSV